MDFTPKLEQLRRNTGQIHNLLREARLVTCLGNRALLSLFVGALVDRDQLVAFHARAVGPLHHCSHPAMVADPCCLPLHARRSFLAPRVAAASASGAGSAPSRRRVTRALGGASLSGGEDPAPSSPGPSPPSAPSASA